MDAKKLAEEAIEHTKQNRTVTMTEEGTDENGKTQKAQYCVAIAVDGNTSSMKGTTIAEETTAEVIGVGGKTYIKAPAVFYAREAGTTDPATVAKFEQAVGGKYVLGDDNGSQNTGDFFGGKTDGLTKGETTDFRGKKVVPLSWTDADGVRKTVYVAASGEAAVVGQLEEKSPARIESTVTSYGSPCEVAAPPADQTITRQQAREAVAAQG